MIAMEDLKKTSHHLSNAATSSQATATGNQSQSFIDAERTYVFPGDQQPSQQFQIPSALIGSTIRTSSGHARSISHGGGQLMTAGGRPLKSAMKGGHQRALSQGHITDHLGVQRSGHSRVGSRTDFVLPPSHKEADENRRESGLSARLSITGFRGHSRQASRSESIYTLRRQDLPVWWKRFFFCRKSKFEDHGFRVVVPNHTVPPKTPNRDHPNHRHKINKIRTTKYTLLSFLPKNLLEQFHRVANLYFIFIVLLNWLPQINAFGKEIAMIPVLFVLGVTAIKDLFEDRRRRASDKRINATTCRVYNG
jgi:phospholipid-translocating ATPase